MIIPKKNFRIIIFLNYFKDKELKKNIKYNYIIVLFKSNINVIYVIIYPLHCIFIFMHYKSFNNY